MTHDTQMWPILSSHGKISEQPISTFVSPTYEPTKGRRRLFMRKTPSSTYRLQLHAGFNFDAALAIADYLSELGISHVYSSPYLQTAPGSTHGYDVADFKSINQELGGASAHERFCKRLGECGLGQILDIVPNHMSLAQNNPY